MTDLRAEKFCQCVASGMTAKEAYLAVQPGCKPNSASTCAWRMLRRPDVDARIKELRDASAGTAVMSLAEKRELLAKLARDSQAEWPARVRAIQVDNDMAGHNRPQEHEVHAHVEGAVEVMSEEFAARMAAAFLLRQQPPRAPNPAERNDEE